MNQMTVLRESLQGAEAELRIHQDKYYWVKGYGTGWMGSHYGMNEEEYNTALMRNTELRRRVLRIMQEIERRKKPGRMRPSMVST